ncbi:MAG: ABC transporter ATP-binding protein [Ktedonobacterales bacterium]
MPEEEDTAAAETPSAIEVRDLVKRYPGSPGNAVDGVSFSVQRGEIFGLLGPNGAGKTTTIGVLTTAVQPTSGYAGVMGIDVTKHPAAVKQRIAVVPQQSNLDRSLRVREILTFHGAYHGAPKAEREARADSLLSEMGLIERKNDKPDRYSGGMNQRLMIARALMHSPDVLFLDEPTNNLDPQSRLFLWERIQSLKAQGLTILLTTHDISEAEQLCERVAIMDYGKILVNDTPAELKKIIPGANALEVRVRIPEAVSLGADGSRNVATAVEGEIVDRIREALRRIPGVAEVDVVNSEVTGPLAPAGSSGVTAVSAEAGKSNGKPTKSSRGRSQGSSWGGGGGGAWGGASSNGGNATAADEEAEAGTILFRLYAENTAGLITGVSEVLAEAGAEVRDLHLKKPSLEDVFIYLTGRNLR